MIKLDIFNSPIVLTLITITFVVLFAGLGFWQLDRAEQKRQLAVTIESQRSMEPFNLKDLVMSTTPLTYRPVVATGHYRNDRTILIENRKHQGKPGFHVITPLQIDGTDRYVLVNRGWVKGANNAAVQLPTETSPVTVEGLAKIPSEPWLKLTMSHAESASTPRWPYLSTPQFEQWSKLPIYPFLIVQKNSSVFIPAWQESPPVNDTMHIGYAIQWFAFALIASVLRIRGLLARR